MELMMKEFNIAEKSIGFEMYKNKWQIEVKVKGEQYF